MNNNRLWSLYTTAEEQLLKDGAIALDAYGVGDLSRLPADKDAIRAVEDKARIVGYTRLIRRSIRRKGMETETGKAEIDLWTRELLELLERVDTLVF